MPGAERSGHSFYFSNGPTSTTSECGVEKRFVATVQTVGKGSGSQCARRGPTILVVDRISPRRRPCDLFITDEVLFSQSQSSVHCLSHPVSSHRSQFQERPPQPAPRFQVLRQRLRSRGGHRLQIGTSRDKRLSSRPRGYKTAYIRFPWIATPRVSERT